MGVPVKQFPHQTVSRIFTRAQSGTFSQRLRADGVNCGNGIVVILASHQQRCGPTHSFIPPKCLPEALGD
jgi:hypothetical protein